MQIVPTIRVVNPDAQPGGLPYMIINEADFNPAVHKKYTGEAKEPPKQPQGKQVPGLPEGYEIAHVGGGNYAVKLNGVELTDSDGKQIRVSGKEAAVALALDHHAAHNKGGQE